MRIISNMVIFLRQKLRAVENFHREFVACDMSYEEFKQSCRKHWEVEYIYLYVDEAEMKDWGNFCIPNESKVNYIECTLETVPSWYENVMINSNLKNVVFNWKTDDLESMNDLASLRTQLKDLRLQGKLGKLTFMRLLKKFLNRLMIHTRMPPEK